MCSNLTTHSVQTSNYCVIGSTLFLPADNMICKYVIIFHFVNDPGLLGNDTSQFVNDTSQFITKYVWLTFRLLFYDQRQCGPYSVWLKRMMNTYRVQLDGKIYKQSQCAVDWVIIGSGNGPAPVRRQAVIKSNGDILPMGLLEKQCHGIGIKIRFLI